METTNLVTKSGDTVVSSNMISSYVKKAPVDKVILVGTGSTSSSSSSASASIGTTVPAGEMQQWAHDYLLSNGYTEADFTATVYIITHESGWSVTATNPSSGAYGLPQGVALQQDGERGRRLGHQLSDPAQVVLGLLRAALWFHSGSLHVLAGQSLLLNRD